MFIFSFLMLIPVLLVATGFGILGGLVAGVVGGLLLGPLMPQEVANGTPQTLTNWLARLAFYAGLGAFSGWLFGHLHRVHHRQHALVRTDLETGLPNQAALEEDVSPADHAEPVSMQHDRAGLVLLRAVDMGEALEVIGSDAGAHIFPELAERFLALDSRVAKVYRFSSFELAVVLRGVDAESLAMLAQWLRERAEEPVPVRGIPVCLEVASGAALADADWIDGQTLIRRARIALTCALEHHHAAQVYEPELETLASETVRLVAQLRTGLDDGDVLLYYQPKIRLATGAITGCESLIRWQSPEHGLVLPGQFMPKVERTSLITPITQFVARTACDFAAKLPAARPVSINLASRNLFDPLLMEWLRELVEGCAIAPEALEIEITERALIRNPDEASRVISGLREIGVGVSIDDFGTGYSSLQYLRQLPVTGLKIDRAFVHGLEEDDRARGLLACIIDAGHALGMEVTAEGVETSGQAEIARELGCDLAQGFRFAYPMPEASFREWVRGAG